MFFGIALVWLGFLAALGASGLYFAVGRGAEHLRGLARGFFTAMSVSLVGAAAYLLYLILSHQFQVQYVYQYSARDLTTYYLVSCFWGGQQGTFLLWAMYGGLVGLVLMRVARVFEGWTMFFLGLVQSFLLLLLVQKNPFELLPGGAVPADGQGLNPLLQDPWMVIHPPILFLGFTSMVVPFVFAMAALVKNDTDGWVRPVLPWSIFGSWVLGTGLVMGGFWAYKVLGWGGYWAWDPVENSSLIPWLCNTALIHGLLLQRANGSLKRANLLLGMFPFLLVVWGTFLTRSGVLADFSVHSFLDLGITGYLVAFIAVFAVIGLGLFAWRFGGIKAARSYDKLASREFVVLIGIILLTIACGLTLLGMSSPLISKLFGPPAAVDTAFYNRIMIPIAILMSFGIATAIMFKWRSNDATVISRFVGPLILAAALTIALAVWRVHDTLPLTLIGGGFFAAFANVKVFLDKKSKEPIRMGAYLAHFGFGLVLVGAVVSNGYELKQKMDLPQGTSVHAFGYDLVYRGITPSPDGKDLAVIDVTHGEEMFKARPKIYFSAYNQGVMRKPAIRRGATHDLYIAPIEEMNPSQYSGETEMKKDEVQDVGGFRVHFDGLRAPDRASMMSGKGGTVYADITLTDAQGTQTHLSPAVKVGGGGPDGAADAGGPTGTRQVLHPADLPGGAGTVNIEHIKVEEKKVTLALAGVGLPGELELTRGGVGQAGPMKVEFVGFRVPGGADAGKNGHAAVFVDLRVTPKNGKAQMVSPSLEIAMNQDGGQNAQQQQPDGGDSQYQVVPAPVPGAGQVKLAGMNANDGSVKLAWSGIAGSVSGAPPTLAVEVTIKPYILVFWIGTLLVSLGFLVTLIRRAKEWSAAA